MRLGMCGLSVCLSVCLWVKYHEEFQHKIEAAGLRWSMTRVCLLMSVFLCVCLSGCLSICISACLCVCLYRCVSFCLSVGEIS